MAIDKTIKAGAPIIGGVLGMIGARDRERTAHLRNLQYMDIQNKYNQQMMEQAKKNELQMWNDTNYGAQIKHMKKAGLNVGMMYGMGGGQGATTGAGGTPTSGMGIAPNVDTVGSSAQGAMTAASIKLMEANAEKAKAEADKTKGVDTEKAIAEIQNITENTNQIGELIQSEKVKREGNRLQNTFQGIQNFIAETTKEMNIDKLGKEIEKLKWEAEDLMESIELKGANVQQIQETLPLLVEQMKENITNLQVDTLLKHSGIGLNEQQAKALTEQISQEWAKIDQTKLRDEQSYQAAISSIKTSVINTINSGKYGVEASKEIKSGMMWSAGINTGGRILDKVIEMGTIMKPKPIKGFGRK